MFEGRPCRYETGSRWENTPTILRQPSCVPFRSRLGEWLGFTTAEWTAPDGNQAMMGEMIPAGTKHPPDELTPLVWDTELHLPVGNPAGGENLAWEDP